MGGTMHHLLYLIPVLVVIASTTHAADLDDVPVIDCHVHLWDTNRPEMTWPREEHVKLYKPFLPTTHTPICRANGVKGVVVVLSGQALVDNQWNLNVTAHNARLYRGVVGNMSKAIGTDAFQTLFTKLCEDKRYVGYRLSGRYQDELPDSLIRDLKLTASMGRTVDFLVGSYSLNDVDEIARRVPELEDYSRPLRRRTTGRRSARPGLAARFSHGRQTSECLLQIVGSVRRFKEQPAPENLATYKPTIDLALECFGQDRLIYGSDWPVTTLTGDYKSVINLTKAYFVDKEPSLARKVFHDNAIKFYGIRDHETE